MSGVVAVTQPVTYVRRDMSDRDLLDFVTLAVDISTLAVTGFGLYFVVASLKQAGKQQRIEAGPYVRVDIGSPDEDMPDFIKPEVSYHDFTQASSFILDEDVEAITISAWFRNYQAHPLGMALGITAVFLIESAEMEPVIKDVRIAYLENEKSVLIDLAKIARGQDATVRLLSLSFLDFYDQRHEHTFGGKGTNALHGRLIAVYENGGLTARPEGRSRGNGVDFG